MSNPEEAYAVTATPPGGLGGPLHELHLLFKSLPGVRSEALPLPEVLDREARALVAALRAGSRGARHALESTQQAAPTWQQGRSELASVAPKLEDARKMEAQLNSTPH